MDGIEMTTISDPMRFTSLGFVFFGKETYGRKTIYKYLRI